MMVMPQTLIDARRPSEVNRIVKGEAGKTPVVSFETPETHSCSPLYIRILDDNSVQIGMGGW